MQPEVRSAWPVVAAVLVGLWTVGVTWASQGGWWLAYSLAPLAGGDLWPVGGVAATLVNAGLVAGPAALLRISRQAGVRAAGSIWLAGGGLLAVLGTSRAIPMPYHEWLLICQLLLLVSIMVANWLTRRVTSRRRVPRRDSPGNPLLGLAAGLATAAPWAWAGSLGGPVESVLALAVAAAAGAVAGGLLGDRLRSPGGRDGFGFWTGGLILGVALMLLGASLGASGINLVLMAVLPPLGFVAAALPGGAGRWAIATMVGAATAGPVAFCDPEELSLLLNLGSREIGFWALLAVAVSVLISTLVVTLYAVFLRPGPGRPLIAGVLAVCALAAGTGVYLGPGRPGFFGDRLFVVLRSQADVSGLHGAPAVYERLVDHARTTQPPLLTALSSRGLSHRSYYLVNAVEVFATDPVTRTWLSGRSDVDRVLSSPRLRPLPESLAQARGSLGAPDGPQWNLTLIGAPAAWESGARGQGIVIGTSDSGVDRTHPALAPGYRGGDDSWYDPWNGSAAPVDHGGHGTHTLGSALGRGEIGVAPEAEWIGCVNLDRNLGNPAYYLDCMQFMLAPFPPNGDPFRDGRPERAPHVLTNSWGCPVQEGCDRGSLAPAVRAFRAAGIFFTAAAGNSGPLCQTGRDVPARYPEAFAVGAVDTAGQLATFSSRGPVAGRTKPDIVAPGVGVLSAMPGGGYARLDGTSMATPHVAGVVALMWSANPALVGDISRTEEILRSTATPVTGAQQGSPPLDACGNDPRNATGAGLVDAAAAVAAARAAG